MEAAGIERLRAAGGKVGALSEVEWETLVDRHGIDTVAFATMRAKADRDGRHVGPDEIGKHLPKDEPLAVRNAAVVEEEAPRRPTEPIRKSPRYSQVTTTVDESAPKAAEVVQPEPKPALGAIYKRIPWRFFQDLLRQRPGLTKRELGDAVGRSVESIESLFSYHQAELVSDDSSPKHWWLKGDQRARAGAAAPVQLSSEAPEIVKQPEPVVAATCAENVQPEPKAAENVTVAEEPAAPVPRHRRSKPSRALEADPVVIAFRRSELDRVAAAQLLEQLVQAYADHHELEILPAPAKRLRRYLNAVFPA